MGERCRFCGTADEDEANCPVVVAVAIVVGETFRTMLGGDA
jgi:hypothetical protein